MDKRGLTTDPNRNSGNAAQWWESLGPTQKPSPYAYAAWKYIQNFSSEFAEVIVTPELVYDNGTSFPDYLYSVVWDGGLFNPPVAPSVVLDSGQFNSSGQIVKLEKTTFATVYVYDSLASYPDVNGLNKIILNVGDLATDPDTDVILTEDGFSIYSEVPAQTFDDSPPGVLLGQLDYTLKEKRVDVIGWSHYNWQDATPVRRAFQAMINSLPLCVEGVYVKDSPTAFWIDLGFEYENKGDDELRFVPVSYKGY